MEEKGAVILKNTCTSLDQNFNGVPAKARKAAKTADAVSLIMESPARNLGLNECYTVASLLNFWKSIDDYTIIITMNILIEDVSRKTQ